MASTRQIARLVASRRSPFMPLGSTANFSSSVIRAATPAGPPQAGFRLPVQKTWETDGKSAINRASEYFLLMEMFRGMYVVIEQFFRPP
jgi:NADH dehydrogenase (ubiquinone) Fe-S protein 8